MFADEPFKNCCWGEISGKHLIYKSKQFVRFCLSKKKKNLFFNWWLFCQAVTSFTQLACEHVSSFDVTRIVFFKDATQSNILAQYEESESFGM